MKLDLLAIAPHPDDVELACSGTLMLHIAQGMKVGVIDLTRGELGTRGTAASRLAEAAAAAQVMGIHLRENLGMEDGFFANDKAHQLQLIQAIRRFQPEVVIANALEDRHPDHGRAARLIADSCFLSGLRKIETSWEGRLQAAWRPKQVFHFMQDRYLKPDFILDISDYMERKIAAIRCYRSQFFVQDYASDEPQTYISTPEFLDSIIGRAQILGKRIGVKYGEGFTTEAALGIRSLKDLLW